MNQILRFLFENPILILILVGWLFSALAGAATKAAKRQAQPRSRPRPEFDALRDQQRQAEREQEARTAQAPAPPQAEAPRSPDEIARQLREMLGLEPAPSRAPEPPAPAPAPARSDEARTSAWDRHTGDDEDIHVPTVPVGQLREDLTRKRAEPKELAQVSSQIGKTAVGGLLQHHIAAPGRGGARRVAFSRKHAIAAVIGMEVLGAPRALRPYRGPGEQAS